MAVENRPSNASAARTPDLVEAGAFGSCIAMMEWSVDNDGYMALPQGVGLGVEMDAKILEEEAKKPQSYKWPGMKLKDGSVADY